MCFEGKYVTIYQDIANHMDTYFCEIGEKLRVLSRTLAMPIIDTYQLG